MQFTTKEGAEVTVDAPDSRTAESIAQAVAEASRQAVALRGKPVTAHSAWLSVSKRLPTSTQPLDWPGWIGPRKMSAPPWPKRFC